MFNLGDFIFQVLMFLFLIGIISIIVGASKSLFSKKKSNENNRIEQKLDKVIELLEKDKN
ncbi:DUF4083 family protein [Cytobacillus sp. Sa5YUA1]|uniref:DUF4083 family protein n=1 Tax=Cytobacillus stercorigallinarum TaxID=2762240 RepID=A0ABR8QNS1_9BACI|nr:DUF4083 family protein [Cytobacillus stercorigallinarum]MBD7937160.1 DUF4083 family protein [Cytobacillus stercorigallinarum]